jgi:succinate-acetate transporter protein
MAIYRERWTPAGPIRSSLPPEVIAQDEERAASSVAEPSPLGLWAFAAGTFTISAVFAGWFTPTTAIFAMVPLILFGGVAQFLAGMWSYRKGDTFAATAFCSFGGLNASYGSYVLLAKAGLITLPAAAGAVAAAGPSAATAALATAGFPTGPFGIFFCCLCCITFFLMIAALWRNVVVAAVLFCLMVAYGLWGIYMLAGNSALILHTGGYCGLVSSTLAFYAGGAVVINSISARQILPLGPALPVNVEAVSEDQNRTAGDAASFDRSARLG